MQGNVCKVILQAERRNMKKRKRKRRYITSKELGHHCVLSSMAVSGAISIVLSIWIGKIFIALGLTVVILVFSILISFVVYTILGGLKKEKKEKFLVDFFKNAEVRVTPIHSLGEAHEKIAKKADVRFYASFVSTEQVRICFEINGKRLKESQIISIKTLDKAFVKCSENVI